MSDKTVSRQPVPDYLVAQWLPEELKEMVGSGRISDAEQALTLLLAREKPGTSATRRLVVEKERLRLLKVDFPMGAPEMLAKIRKDIPDATEIDLAGWTKTARLQWLKLDGEIRYFRREPSNLYRLSSEARARRDAAMARDRQTSSSSAPAGDPAAGRRQTLLNHIQAALKAADDGGTSLVLPCEFKVRHLIAVRPDMVPAGEMLRCWIPFPQAYRQQSAGMGLRTRPDHHTVSPEGTIQRTIYLEQPAGPGGEYTTFTAEYSYTSHAYVSGVDPAKVRPTDLRSEELRQYLGEQAPHLVITPEVRRLAAQIVADETNPYRKAERIFRWFDADFRYCSEMNYAVMPSVVEKAMAARMGDCGVHALLFVALCRASGVPARWQSGWVARPDYWNMHDWAEFHAEPYGWLPADPSVGLQKSEDPRVRDFLFGNTDAYRMIANTGFDTAFIPPEQHWRSDPVDSQRGEVQWRGGNLCYDQWDSDIKVTVHPASGSSR